MLGPASGSVASFDRLPTRDILTQRLDTPEPWNVQALSALQDLDNLRRESLFLLLQNLVALIVVNRCGGIDEPVEGWQGEGGGPNGIGDNTILSVFVVGGVSVVVWVLLVLLNYFGLLGSVGVRWGSFWSLWLLVLFMLSVLVLVMLMALFII